MAKEFQHKTTFDPFEATGVEVPKKNRKEALDAAAEYVRDAVLDFIGEGKSPIAGGQWTRSLKGKYAKEKDGAAFSNLELSGELLDSLYVERSGSGLEIGVGKDQAGKAEGNQLGTYGKDKSTGRLREFLIQPGDEFKGKIVSGLRNILEDFKEDDGEDS